MLLELLVSAVLPVSHHVLLVRRVCYRVAWLNPTTANIWKGSCMEESEAERIANKMNHIRSRWWVEKEIREERPLGVSVRFMNHSH